MPRKEWLSTVLGSLALLGIGVPFVLLLHYLGQPALERPSAIAAMMMALAFKSHWRLRTRWWFWPTMLGLALLHTLLIILVPWPSGWIPAPIMVSFAILDLIVIYGLIRIFEKLDGETNPHQVSAP